MKTTQTEAETLGYTEASEQFKTQREFSSGRTWDNDTELNEAYDRGVNRAEAERAQAETGKPEQHSLKDIPGVPGYKASADGHIHSFASNWRGYGPRQLEECTEKDGYKYVRVQINGKRELKRVHALVCLAFHGPYTIGQETRHLNGDRKDNRAENLAWGTRQENANDRLAHGNAPRGKTHSVAIKAGIQKSREASHSPLPWKVGNGQAEIDSSNGDAVALIVGEQSDRAFIIHAVNNAQRLADALRKANTCASLPDSVRQVIRGALSAWEGAQQQ